MPGIAKFDRTAAKEFHFAMQNKSCIPRDGRQLIPTKLTVSHFKDQNEAGMKNDDRPHPRTVILKGTVLPTSVLTKTVPGWFGFLVLPLVQLHSIPQVRF